MRIWERPVDEVLAAGLAVLPLAPVSAVGPDRLPDVLTTMARRLKDETAPERVKLLWVATKILMGLRYPRDQIDLMLERISAMFLGIHGIEESWVYQDIFAKGKTEGLAEGKAEGLAAGKAEGLAAGQVEKARQTLLRLGRRKFGPPAAEVEARIAALNDTDRLDALLDCIIDVTTWEELLGPDQPPAG